MVPVIAMSQLFRTGTRFRTRLATPAARHVDGGCLTPREYNQGSRFQLPNSSSFLLLQRSLPNGLGPQLRPAVEEKHQEPGVLVHLLGAAQARAKWLHGNEGTLRLWESGL